MHVHERTVEVDGAMLAQADRLMTTEPSCAAECLDEDEAPFTLGVDLPDGVTAYLQCRGAAFGSTSNTAYTDAVLCDLSGVEIESEFEPPESGGFSGTWHIEGNGVEYVIKVTPLREIHHRDERRDLPPCPWCGDDLSS